MPATILRIRCSGQSAKQLRYGGKNRRDPALTDPNSAAIVRRGEMTERPKVPDSKSGVPVRVPWVRIPLSPLRVGAR